MIDAREPLQRAVLAAAKADATVAGLVGTKLYDRVPQGAQPPYIKLRPMDANDASDQCHDGVEVFVDLDGWSEAVGAQEANRIGAALAAALDAPITVAGFEVIIHEVVRLRTTPEADGLTHRADVGLRYVLAPTA